jgi:hypothetical protein
VDAVEHDDALGDRRARRRLGRVGEGTSERVAGGVAHPGAHPRPRTGGPDDVAEHGAGLDGGQLAGVADEHEAGVGPDRLDEARHERQRDHRRLVDDDDVVREPVGAVVAEAAVAVGSPAEQAVQRRGLEREEVRADRSVDRELRSLLVHRLLQPGGGLAGRRGERDEQVRRARSRGLLGQERDDARDGSRLAGARTPGDDGKAPQDRRDGRERLPAVLLSREKPADPVGEHVGGDVHRRPARQRAQVGGHLPLLAPVAVQVQQGPHESQRPVGRPGRLAAGHEGARGDARRPRPGSRPRQRAEVDRLLGVDRRGVADGRQVDQDVAEPRTAHGEGDGQGDPVVLRPGQGLQPPGDVDVGRREHARGVECPEEPGRLSGAANVEGVDLVGAAEVGHAAPPRSRTSLRAVTSDPEGHQEKTPHGIPLTVGVSAPVIPRRKRYRTPARWMSAS